MGWVRGAAPSHSAQPRLPPTRPRCPPPAAGPSRSEGTRALPPRPPASPRQPLGEEEAARLRHRQPLGRERGAARRGGGGRGEALLPLPAPARRVHRPAAGRFSAQLLSPR
ncbi:atherin-like [Strigops habroptila]|uniref:atherin-like n=1 Tax=Strigops habroptila TaxID=2489341 RepID=UPI0011D00DD2|nr:atherin-like [Strigops habroptila]